MRYLLAIFLAAPALAQVGHVFAVDTRVGFCNVTAATNTTPIRVTVSNIAQCPKFGRALANGDLIRVDSVYGNWAANVHCEDPTCDHQVYQVAGLSGNSFFLKTKSGANTAGSGIYVAGTGRIHSAIDLTRKTDPIGPWGGAGSPRLTYLMSAKVATGSNPAYSAAINDATIYQTLCAGHEWNCDALNPGGKTSGVYGRMSRTVAMKYQVTGDTGARDLLKWSVGTGFDQLFGSPACFEASGVCGISASGKMDYAAELKADAHMLAYTVIRRDLSAAEIANNVGFYLSDLPWTEGGIGYTGTALTKPAYQKSPFSPDGTVTLSSLGKNITITGSGTHFTKNGCAVGDFIIVDTIYSRDMKISNIASDTSLTVEVAADDAPPGAGKNYACGPKWTTAMYGWLWFIKHYTVTPLSGGTEHLAPTTPPQAQQTYGTQGHYGPGGSADDGFNNHSHHRSVAMLKVGLALCADDVRACHLAGQADAYLNDASMPYILMTWTGSTWNGNTYDGSRIKRPFLDWAEWRVGSLAGARDPFENTNLRQNFLEWWMWTAIPFWNGSAKTLKSLPHADYSWISPEESYNQIASLMSLGWDNTTVWARNFFHHFTVKNWFGGGASTYSDRAAAIGSPSGFNNGTEYFYYRPDTTATAISDLTKLFTNPNLTECISRFGKSRCTAGGDDVYNFAISRTSWALTDETIVAVNGESIWCRDHCADVAGGFYYIFKNGQPLLATDGGGLWGNGNSYSVAKRGYLLVGTATDPALATKTNDSYNAVGGGYFGDGYGGTPILSAYGSNSYMMTELDLRKFYKAGAAVTAMRRRNGHAKGRSQDFVFDHVYGTMSSPKPFKGVQHLWLNGCGTSGASPCIAVDNTSKTFSNSQNPAGTSGDAALSCKVFGISGTMNLTTEKGSLTNGSYDGGPGSGYSFRVNVQPASGDATGIEYVVICRPTATTSSTLPEITPSTVSGWRIFNIAERGSESILALQAGGAASGTLSFTGAGEYLYASGFSAGTYYGKNGGAAISGCQGLVVTSRGQTLECANVGTGPITFDQTPP